MTKNVDTDRARPLERLLRETLQARGPIATLGDCLAAEAAAAWADDTLGRDERAEVEAHAADCARCQALLAAMVRTSPPAAAPRAWVRPATLGWLAPLAAMAAAVIVWMILPPSATLAPPAAAPVARLEPAATPPTDAVAPVKGAAAALPPSAPRFDSKAPADDRRQEPLLNKARGRQEDEQHEKNAGRADSASGARRGDAASGFSRTNTSPANALADVAGGAPARAAAPPPPAATPNAASAAPAVAAQSDAPSAAKKAEPEALAFRSTAESTLLKSVDAVQAAMVIVSTNPNSQWRMGAAGTVLHTLDGGSRWETQRTGVTVVPTAGTSPSPSTCWLVGPHGTVLLSRDGRSWQTLRFPEPVDLVSISAADDSHATVTASDGRAFSTSDRGGTWAASGNR